MKLKKIELIILFAMIMLVTMGTVSFGSGFDWKSGDTLQASGWPNNIYCTAHGVPLAADSDYSSEPGMIHFEHSKDEAADITVAYALYYGLTGKELQDVIWASPNNVGNKVTLTNPRVIEYRDVYNQIFSKVPANQNVITNTEKSENIKVLVDRVKKTYTVGPYKLDLRFKDGVSNTTKANLLDEIRTGKEGTAGVYAMFTGITGINGEILEIVDKDGKTIKSQNGLAYGFPDFGQEFYIRFKPDKDGAIVSTGEPNFHIKLLRNVTGTIHKNDATQVDYKLKDEYVAYVEEQATMKCNWTPPHEGEPGTYHEHYVDAELNTTITITCRENGVSGVNTLTDTRTEKGQVKVSYRYDEYGYLAEWNKKAVNWNITKTGSYKVKPPSGDAMPSIQTLSNPEPGKPEWVEEEKREADVPPFEDEQKYWEGYKYDGKPEKAGLKLPGALIDMQIGGHVWLEEGGEKTGEPDGRMTNKDKPFAGIQVDLYESNGTLVTTTTTDKNGKYRFYGRVGDLSLLNPLKQYYVVFEYDGQRYQATYYYNSVASPGGYSNARDVKREEYNAKFKLISANPNNYTPGEIKPTGADKTLTGLNRAYGIDHKIAKDNGEYATTGEKNSEGKEIALTYEDVYNKFLEISTSSDFGDPKKGDSTVEWKTKQNNYYKSMDALKEWLKGKGVTKEFESIQSFIFDSLMTSSTQKDQSGNTVLYPKYDKFVLRELYNTKSDDYKKNKSMTLGKDNKYYYLYTSNYDMARYVDFGLWVRPNVDIRLQKDLYKTTVIINGKQEVYEYAKRDLSADPSNRNWDIRVRASDALYNGIYSDGTKAYRRDVRGSEYLIDEESFDNVLKKLKAYVTYRIAFKNCGQTNVKVNEIVDHFDTDYTFDRSDEIIDKNTYIGDYSGNRIKDVAAKESGTFTDKYKNLYLTGMDDMLKPGGVAWVYVTFKVNDDPETQRIKLDYKKNPLTTEEGELLASLDIGKQNIAEINSYETYYIGESQDGIKDIPDYLEKGKNKKSKNVAGKVAGLVDFDSNPGSLSELDLDEQGNLKITRTNNEIEGKAGIIASDRQEDDSSQAPNIRFLIPPTNDTQDTTRRLKGYVFEDGRTDTSSGATIGDGIDNNETKIDGVKVELVELVPEVDVNGLSTHKYLGEKVWYSQELDGINLKMVKDDDQKRYSSGDGESKVIITGKAGTILEVKKETGLNQGEYSLISIPAGDFFVRFTYGDDVGTTLVKTQALRDQLSDLSDDAKARKEENIKVNEVLGAEGRNAKSYNGQDFKSTVYQKGISQDGEYYDIKAYKNYVEQNYTKGDEELSDGTDKYKSTMYYYDIKPSEASAVVSDAKDVWYYRNRSNEYGKGIDLGSNKVLLNKRAETLASFEKLSSYAYTDGEIKNENSTENGYTYGEEGEKNYDLNNAYYKNQQKDMLEAFMNNTYMVAQTGVINTEIELDRNTSVYEDNDIRDRDTLNYTIENINLGLTERPKAQLKLGKKFDNYTVTLNGGRTIYDASKSQNNLAFSNHTEHSAKKDEVFNLFEKGEPRVSRPGSDAENKNSEIVQNYLDNESQKHAALNLKYKLFVENVSETDYVDQKFYYTGIEDNASGNISKTSAKKIVDYVTNELNFNAQSNDGWNVSSADQLMPSRSASDEDKNFVNRLYNDEIVTYKTLITADLSEELIPGQRKEIDLQLSRQLADGMDTSKVFNNMAEIVATYNDLGRRCVYSIPGNEEMADQLLGDNAARQTRSRLNRVQVKEIDADSSQEVKVLPPTGVENKKASKLGEFMKNGIASILGIIK